MTVSRRMAGGITFSMISALIERCYCTQPRGAFLGNAALVHEACREYNPTLRWRLHYSVTYMGSARLHKERYPGPGPFAGGPGTGDDGRDYRRGG